MRRIVGQRMTQSKQTAPHFYVTMDIDMTKVTRLRAEGKNRGESNLPSINDFILHACARALKDFPALNSTYTEQGIMTHADINIGTRRGAGRRFGGSGDPQRRSIELARTGGRAVS